jgi:hypothetical protein
MLIVCAEEARVVADLGSGALWCPSCRGRLGPCRYARRRAVRCVAGDLSLRPRRARC